MTQTPNDVPRLKYANFYDANVTQASSQANHAIFIIPSYPSQINPPNTDELLEHARDLGCSQFDQHKHSPARQPAAMAEPVISRPSVKPSRPSLGQILSLPPHLLGMYEEFITKNASQVSQIESALRSLTYVIPGWSCRVVTW
jgi:hypothetical protein